MTGPTSGILSRLISDTPIAVVDLETTGLRPGSHRVIELSVVRIEPGRPPELVLDTLVNPARPVAASHIHGVCDQDVADAPIFAQVTPQLIHAISGCAVAAYNASFDLGFLEFELRRAALSCQLPYLCLMYLRPMLALGQRCSLNDACLALGVEQEPTHEAAADALAAAHLWHFYLEHATGLGLRTFADLANLHPYKFTQSFRHPPLDQSVARELSAGVRLKPRSQRGSVPASPAGSPVSTSTTPDQGTCREYWDAFKAVLADLQVSDEEVMYLRRKREALGLTEQQVHSLHARAFGSVLEQFAEDQWLDDKERRTLHRLHQCLSRLGWAPGE